MRIKVLTIFPDMVRAALGESIVGRALEKGLLTVECIDIRAYSQNKHKNTDDYPFGGGAGMVMLAQPICDAVRHLRSQGYTGKCIYMSPRGKTLTQQKVVELAGEENLILLCGHYEGIDERVLEEIVTDYVSVGDYVLTGGELPAMVMVDAISRLVPGVLHNDVSAEFESFQDNLLEYPQYSRPEEWHGRKVPEVLLSGHHANIEKWRREQSILRTFKRRPDLLEKCSLTDMERKWLEEQTGKSDLGLENPAEI